MSTAAHVSQRLAIPYNVFSRLLSLLAWRASDAEAKRLHRQALKRAVHCPGCRAEIEDPYIMSGGDGYPPFEIIVCSECKLVRWSAIPKAPEMQTPMANEK
jgi:hypothetical protein